MRYSPVHASILLFFIFCFLTNAGCSRHTTPPNLFDTQKTVAEYIAGNYNLDFANTVAAASNWLKARDAKPSEKLAIVLDIDETSLSNWPAYKLNNYARIVNGPCDLEKGPCGLRAWQGMAASPALAPTVELVRLAKSRGIAVFFISARPPELQEATEKTCVMPGINGIK